MIQYLKSILRGSEFNATKRDRLKERDRKEGRMDKCLFLVVVEGRRRSGKGGGEGGWSITAETIPIRF